MDQRHPTGILAAVAVFLLCALAAVAGDVTVQDLPNGLRVIVKEVHAAPVVTVDSWYKVGSRNEWAGMTGSSHLLEHMTYKGTRTFSKDEMRALAKRNGAIDNGATYYDYTHYYTTIASDRVALPLRIEAARMSSALIRQEDLDKEFSVVRSELEGDENNPFGVLFQQTMAAAYTSHPYHWPVIGWRADVEHTKADALRRYYQTFYMPNNATLVIVGDVNTAQVLGLVKKYFAPLKRGPQPEQWVTPEPAQQGERRVMVRRQGQVPIELITYHIPDINHPDIPALMLLDQVLGTGRTSHIYQQVVEAQLGVNAWSATLLRRDDSIFYLGGVAAPGQPLAPIETTLLAEVEKIKQHPPTAEEMARGLKQLEASIIYGRDSVTDQASQLGYYATVAGDWAYQDKLVARLRAVTPEDVSRVARTYLTEANRTVGIFQPTAEAGEAAAARPLALQPAAYQPAAPAPAGAGPATGIAVAQPAQRQRIVLPNGVVLIVQENHANTTVAASINLRAGKAYDPAGKAGAADMVANLLDRGTTTRSSAQIATELEGAAAEVSAGTGWETLGMHGKALSGDLDLLIRNMADELRNPTFPAAEIEKMRGQMLSSLALDRDDPAENARRAFYRAALPADHPYRLHSFEEEEAGLKALTRDDLVAFHRAHYTPRAMIISVVGDVTIDQVRTLVEKYFGDWQGETPAPLAFTPAAPGVPQRVVTTIAGKSEVDIYVGSADTLTRTSPDYYAAEVMNMILGGGGALNSRLGDVIRDQHGLAYSVYSDFHASTGAGPWYAMMGVNPQNVDQAITLLQAEIARMRDTGATAQEVKDAVAFITGAYAITLETNAALANTLLDAEYFHLGLDYPERATRQYSAVTLEQVNAAARKYLHPENLVTSIAGTYKGAQ